MLLRLEELGSNEIKQSKNRVINQEKTLVMHLHNRGDKNFRFNKSSFDYLIQEDIEQ